MQSSLPLCSFPQQEAQPSSLVLCPQQPIALLLHSKLFYKDKRDVALNIIVALAYNDQLIIPTQLDSLFKQASFSTQSWQCDRINVNDH